MRLVEFRIQKFRNEYVQLLSTQELIKSSEIFVTQP